MEKKFFSMFEPGTRLTFFLLAAFCVVSAFFNFYVFLIELVLVVAAYVFHILTNESRRRDVAKYIEGLGSQADLAAKSSLLSFPLAMCFVRSNGTISWYNERFSDAVGGDAPYLFERRVEEVLPGVDVKAIIEGREKGPVETRSGDKSFDVYINVIPTGSDSKKLLTLYLVDSTELALTKKELNDRQNSVGIAMIDNYDEIMQNTKELEKANAVAMVDKRLTSWAEQGKTFIQRFDRDKYMFVMEEPALLENIEARFPILDSIKDVAVGANRMPVTLSISIGRGGDTFAEKFELARAAIEVALGRGGDQVVIKTRDQYEYYGGKAKTMEKRTKVKARVVATALKELIRDCENILIMGHRFADIDSVGAGVGIYRIARNFMKPARIVINQRSEMVARLIDKLREDPVYEDAFITPDAAMTQVGERTLMVVVDTHSPDYAESEELLELCSRVVVIDHHRRGANFVKNPALVFHEPYASSACEMVTEILSYLDENTMLTKDEASALLAGVILDTKGFTMKTGVRTFEAASYLKRAGADTLEAKMFFRSDMSSYQARIAFISGAQTYRDVCVIAASENVDQSLSKEVFAQSVDEMLNISNVKAAFGIAVFGGEVHISARSYGGMNVQTILEKLGGGGHQTVAGAQLSEVTIEDVKARLLTIIDDVIEFDRESAQGGSQQH